MRSFHLVQSARTNNGLNAYHVLPSFSQAESRKNPSPSLPETERVIDNLLLHPFRFGRGRGWVMPYIPAIAGTPAFSPE